jgi:hypothetical protein
MERTELVVKYGEMSKAELEAGLSELTVDGRVLMEERDRRLEAVQKLQDCSKQCRELAGELEHVYLALRKKITEEIAPGAYELIGMLETTDL